MADFWRWEYQYGHDLDPNAAIQVPGMAYQPPLIGYKQLLNFAAYSMPATGGWLFIIAGVIITGALIYETRFRKSTVQIAAIMFFFSAATSCNEGPGQINYGSDNCDYCKMTLTDTRFGIILNSNKGRNYKFDDFHCLAAFKKENPVIIGTTYVAEYNLPNAMHPLKNMQLLESAEFKSPMGGNIAAFANKDSMVHYRELTGAATPSLPFTSE
jgi:copper chaperone NosL